MGEWIDIAVAYEHILDAEMHPATAQQKLRQHIYAGTIPAKMLDCIFDGSEISELYFKPDHHHFDPERGLHLDFGTGEGRHFQSNDSKSLTVIDFINMVVSKDHVYQIWPAKTSSPKAVASKITGGGRPSTYDWASAAGHIAGYIAENDYPKTQADLQRVLAAWFGDKQPDEKSLKDFVREVWKHKRG